MPIPELPTYVAPFIPVPQITPLTYRDGLTMLKKLDNIVRYMNRTIVPFINTNFDDLAHEVEDQINILIAQVNAAIDEVINDSVDVQDPVVAQLIENPESLTAQALLEFVDPKYMASTDLDPNTTALINDIDSGVRLALDALYLKISALDDANSDLVLDADSLLRAALDSLYESKSGTRGVTKTIYVRSTGSDVTGDGTSAATAYREIKTAVASIAQFGPLLRGTILIDVGGGSYKGGIQIPTTRGRAQDDFIRIIGPSVGDSPNVPTVFIDHENDDTATYGIQVVNGTSLWVENLKIVGGFDIGLDCRIRCALQIRNVHIDGQNVMAHGMSFLTKCNYDIRGGIIENCVEDGIQEHFGITRTYENNISTATAPIFRNNTVGILSKENCHGHIDYATFDNCGVGFEMHAWSTSNIKATTFINNDVGICIVNSEIHNEGGVIWGTGGTANSRRIVSLGNSDELTPWGWGAGGGDPKIISTGHRPLKMLDNEYSDITVTGSTTEVNAWQSDVVIPAGQLAVKGRHVKVIVWFSVVTAPATTSRIILRLAGSATSQVSIPSTAIATMDMKAEFDVVCSADGNNQRSMASMAGFIPSVNAYNATTINLNAADFSATVGVIHSEAATSITIRAIEVWA